MQVLVVDDESLARQRLVKLVEELENFDVVGEAETGEQACRRVEELDPEIILMDVRMPKLDGLGAAKQIAQLPDPPAIIFCTAYDEYALQAFETFAAGYLVKPVQKNKLAEVLNKVKQLNRAQRAALRSEEEAPIHEQRKHISAKTRNGIELVPVVDIACFVADQKYVTVYYPGGEILIDDTLKDLEQEFPSLFLRVHRNALVAIQAIVGIQKNSESNQYEIKLSASDYRPIISRRHLSYVRDLVAKL